MLLPTFIATLSAHKVTVNDLEAGNLKPIILIDVRSPEEYAQDHIGQSLLVPLEEIQAGQGIQIIERIARAYSQPGQPDPTIVLYCEICPGAIRAYQKLQCTGLNLVVLSGGITAWRQAVPRGKDAEILAPIAIAA
ncbi:Rhodanese-related sulfurtransferase [Leptolyngbyaceae cyanobacterium JSC-12]|nr:Rhodanese-related sulfurtransferase [Leptolyngbyaceae cyanobacterium JSC-12]